MKKHIASCLLLWMSAAPALADAGQDCEKLSGEKAILACDQVLRQNPKSAIAYLKRGKAYLGNGLFPDLIERARLDADDERALEDLARAVADFDKAIALNPNAIEGYLSRADALRAKGAISHDGADFDKAIADLDKAIALRPRDAFLFGKRGDTYRSKGDFLRAIADYNRARQLDPRSNGDILAAVDAKFEMGDFKGVAAEDLRSLELNNQMLTDLRAALAMLYRYLARARIGEPALDELQSNARKFVKNEWATEWPFQAIELYLGKGSEKAVIDAASEARVRCNGQFFVAEWYITKGNLRDAETALKSIIETCPYTRPIYAQAAAELKRISK